jgi:Queuosine biosynthesis protein QueC
MNTNRYTYTFPQLGDHLAPADRYDHRLGIATTFRVQVSDDFHRQVGLVMPEIAADLVDLAVAIHEADSLSPNRGRSPCIIEVVLPLREPARFNAPGALSRLEEVLHWLTEDYWTFTFTQRTAVGRVSERQLRLLPRDEARVEVALWSGGVDSLAGLVSRLFADDSDRKFMLVGSSANDSVTKLQHDLVGHAQSMIKRWDIEGSRIELARAPIDLEGTTRIPKNPMMRSRGLVFGLVGVACALGAGVNSLMVYENGVGAINLPWRPAEVGLHHARGVHPRTFVLMGDLVSHLIRAPFTIENPFVFTNKSQMLDTLRELDAADLIALTRSCDRPHRKKGLPSQCGYCPSCLIRRHSLAEAGITDATRYVACVGGHPLGEDAIKPWLVMDQHARDLAVCLAADDPWYAMGVHFAGLAETAHILAYVTGDDILTVRQKLLDLYARHAAEWARVGWSIRPGFAPSFTSAA